MFSEDAADPMHIGGPDNRKMDLQLLYQLAFGCDLGRVIFALWHSPAFNVRSTRQQPVRPLRPRMGERRAGESWYKKTAAVVLSRKRHEPKPAILSRLLGCNLGDGFLNRSQLSALTALS